VRSPNQPRSGAAQRGDTLGDVTESAELPTLLDISADIAWPDTDAEAATLARLRAAGLGDGTLGRLGDLAGWLSGVQGVSPPREPQRARLVLFRLDDASGDEVASTDVAAVFADIAGVGVRVVELAAAEAATESAANESAANESTAGEPTVEAQTATGNALSPNAVDAAFRTGARIADEEIDSGADLLIAAAAGPAGPSADVVVSIMTLVEPVKVVGLTTTLSDPAWMTWVAEVRDTRLRGLPHRHEVAELLATIGGPELAALTGFLLRAAARRTPVLLDGVSAAAAALLAREISPSVVRWWQPGAGSTSPAHALALEEFAGVPILDLRLRVDDGIGAVLAVQLVRAAARAVNDLTVAAAEDAGVTEAPAVDDDAT
jgi:nicotinate-nucleotide--dimethylbenzimidazole phosphoribosyltransferase